VTLDTGFSVDQDTLDEMQHRAHRYCFVANSIADYVDVTIS
jgi:organic hydroperoxide reductase OsmC/OhrA